MIDLCLSNIDNLKAVVCSDNQIADHANLKITMKGNTDDFSSKKK